MDKVLRAPGAPRPYSLDVMIQRALVVDDDSASRMIYQQILSRLGFTVATAGDGAAALDQLQTLSFDIIFLDMLLPKISGVELLSYIHNAAHLQDTAVVVVSAHSQFASTISLGPRDRFLVKPVLANTLREVTKLVLASAPTASQS